MISCIKYFFDVKWGFDLSVISSKGTDTVSGGRKTFEIKNYSDKEKNVQILAAVKDTVTGELKTVSVSTAANGVIPAGESKSINLTVSFTGINREDYNNHTIYFYFYDSVTEKKNQYGSKKICQVLY